MRSSGIVSSHLGRDPRSRRRRVPHFSALFFSLAIPLRPLSPSSPCTPASSGSPFSHPAFTLLPFLSTRLTRSSPASPSRSPRRFPSTTSPLRSRPSPPPWSGSSSTPKLCPTRKRRRSLVGLLPTFSVQPLTIRFDSPVRRSLPAREEPASDHVADVLLVTEDANSALSSSPLRRCSPLTSIPALPVNTHQVAFFNASLDASLAPSPAADEPRTSPLLHSS